VPLMDRIKAMAATNELLYRSFLLRFRNRQEKRDPSLRVYERESEELVRAIQTMMHNRKAWFVWL
jgi:hypothetical protein